MKRFIHFGSVVVALSLLVFSSLIAHPAQVSAADSSSALSITPRKNHLIKPGQTITDKLTIGNLDHSTDLNLNLRVIDFTFTNQSGTPKLSLAENVPPTTWSLRPFLSLPSTLTLKPGETKTINYTIKIPSYQGAGSYYSAIMYASGAGSGNNVSLAASGATLVFVSVPGTVHEDLKLTKLGAYQSSPGGVSGKYVFIATNSPQQVAFTLKNGGNVTESPAGTIFVNGPWGYKKQIKDVNPTGSLALIGQTRLFTSCILSAEEQVKLLGGNSKDTKCVDPHLKPGKYNVALDILYGQNGNQSQEITGKATFWYLPIWFIILCLVVLLVAAFFIWRLVRKIRRATGRAGSKKRRR
jgi:hypothetical protein